MYRVRQNVQPAVHSEVTPANPYGGETVRVSPVREGLQQEVPAQRPSESSHRGQTLRLRPGQTAQPFQWEGSVGTAGAWESILRYDLSTQNCVKMGSPKNNNN